MKKMFIFQSGLVLTLCLVTAVRCEIQLTLQNCSQSSTHRTDGVCEHAIDGDKNQWYNNGSCTHTKNELAWWQARTPRLARFSSVRIFNRQDCCAGRLRSFRITVDGVECARYTGTVDFSVMDFACERAGQVLRISQLQKDFLTLCEVQVFGKYLQEQPLRLGNCSQSSLSDSTVASPLGYCSNALDGNTNQTYWSGSCTHTNKELGWWEASTESPAMFAIVRIYNRQDCCKERLNSFKISVDGVECARVTRATPFSVEDFQCGLAGTTLRISQLQNTYLTLCEVQAFGEYLTQQLRLGRCSQSSIGYNGFCIRGIDNGLSQNYSDASCTHTQNEIGWWQAHTDGPAFVAFVRIYNRQDCCSERLNNFSITVDGVECASFASNTAFSVKMFECNRIGQVIRINNRMKSYLTLCEVQVLGRLLAPEDFGSQLFPDTCSQSSTYLTGECSRAIDRNTNQVYGNGSCTHTQLERGWWQAELAVPARINAVKIYNRQDCCSCRLNNFAIEVDGAECASYQSDDSFSEKLFKCGKVGSSVRIKNRMQSHLTLCEVQLFGQSLNDRELGDFLPLSNCSQSSRASLTGGLCSQAFDRNTSQGIDSSKSLLSCSLTTSWWQADLERPAHIAYVRIYATENNPFLLNNFTITVNGVECASYESNSPLRVRSFSCNRAGLVLRINNGQAGPFFLCEVEVFGRYIPVEEYGVRLPLTSCSQSSTLQGAVCRRAIDGNTNQLYRGGSCSLTKNQASWWQAQTSRRALITYIRIYNRKDCCPERLNNFVITVNGVECASYNSGSYFLVKTFFCNRVGEIIRISSRISKPLTLCEVQVFGQYKDSKLKLFSCSQSSVYRNGVCNRAIDNNKNQAWLGNSCTHTNAVPGSWWQARVRGGKATITRVVIYNRQDCCRHRLNNFYITVDNAFCASYSSKKAFSVKEFTCSVVGQVIRITSTQREALTLCEVEVFGVPVRQRKRQIPARALGCFADSSDWRDLPIKAKLPKGTRLTAAACNTQCRQLQSYYYGLQGGNECWCGEDYGMYGRQSMAKCDQPCEGDSWMFCGGKLFNLVFKVTG